MDSKFGDWKIVRSLDEGGQGHVYVVQSGSGAYGETQFALKRLKNKNRADRFKKEVEAVEAISHPNIVRILESNFETEKPWFVMDYYPDGNLAEYLQKYKPGQSDLLDIFLQVCDAVRAIHQEGIYHRDVKPENILVDVEQNRFVLADFGIVYIENHEVKTLGFEQLGAKNYIAPELEHGDEPSRPSDVFSLGKLLFFLFAGKALPGNDVRTRTYASDVTSTTPQLELVVELIEKMVQSDPINRPNTVDSVMAEVERITLVLRRDFNVPGHGMPRRCLYCGTGYYDLLAVTRTDIQGLTGMQINEDKDPGLFRCNNCGNMQLFLTTGLARRQWWNKEPI